MQTENHKRKQVLKDNGSLMHAQNTRFRVSTDPGLLLSMARDHDCLWPVPDHTAW